MDNNPIIITENSAFFKKGQILENYSYKDNGIIFEDKFISEDKFLILKENLSFSDEKLIRDIIKQQFKIFFYNLYTKQSTLI